MEGLERFWKSCKKTLMLLFFMFLPLMLNMGIAILSSNDIVKSIMSKIIPGEMLAYCLGLISPLFLLLIKTHGNNFKIPSLQFIFIFGLTTYISALLLTIIAKNRLILGIDNENGHRDIYFITALISLIFAIGLRLFTEYHDSRYSDYKSNLTNQQNDLNQAFQSRLNP